MADQRYPLLDPENFRNLIKLLHCHKTFLHDHALEAPKKETEERSPDEQDVIESVSSVADENRCLAGQDFEDICWTLANLLLQFLPLI